LEEVRAKFSPGLSLEDAAVIKEIVPGVERTASQSEISLDVKYSDRSAKSTVIGITPEFTDVLNYKTGQGDFISSRHYDRRSRVCVLGAGVASALFQREDPLGKMVKLDDQWF